jgi:site-specific recombinase XerD
VVSSRFSYTLIFLNAVQVTLTFNQGVAGSRPARPTSSPPLADLLARFLKSRRQGISSRTYEFYEALLNPFVHTCELTPDSINTFLGRLTCANGKNAYYRAIRAFCNWLHRQGLITDNPIIRVDPPKMKKIILPSLTPEQVDFLIDQATCIRDQAIISLFADTGLRLSELANINPRSIDWEHRLIKVTCKGNREGLALFGERTGQLLKQWLSEYRAKDKLWNINWWGIKDMLDRLATKTGLPCNPHTFRRTFASILAKRGVDALHIKRLGRWESMAMVEHYTRSVRFEDSMRFYTAIVR